jgi:hypothetical protein
MKQEKKLSALAAGAVTMSLLLGASAAQADVVRDPDNSFKAIGITNLDIGGTPYNVDFVGPTEAVNVYGGYPGTLDFTTSDSAHDAVTAVNAALTAADIAEVGPDALDGGTVTYRVGWETFEADIGGVESLWVWEGFTEGVDPWVSPNDPEPVIYNADSRMYADFTVVPVPAAVWLFGSGLLGLIGISRRKKSA